RGRKPGIDLAELHVRFGQRDALHAAHFGVGREQQGELRFKGNFERVFAERALPTVHVGLFGSENNFAAFRQRRCFRDGNRLRRTSGDASTDRLTREGVAACAAQAVSIAKASALAKRSEVVLAPEEAYVDSWQSPFRKDPFEIPLETQLALLLAADAEMRRVKGVTLTETDMQFRKIDSWFAST